MPIAAYALKVASTVPIVLFVVGYDESIEA